MAIIELPYPVITSLPDSPCLRGNEFGDSRYAIWDVRLQLLVPLRNPIPQWYCLPLGEHIDCQYNVYFTIEVDQLFSI